MAMPAQAAAFLIVCCLLGSQGHLTSQHGCEVLDCEDSTAALAAVQLSASMERNARIATSAQGLQTSSCLLAAPELTVAVRDFLNKMGSSQNAGADAGSALAEAASKAGCDLAQWNAGLARRTAKQTAALVSLVESLGNLRLRPSRQESSSGAETTFVFESFDESGRAGTGMLGEGCQGKSVSEVAITVSQEGPFLWTNLTGASMPFKIGPPCANTNLISGTMWPTRVSPQGIVGGIKAAFVNLRSTMSGTWSTGSQGFNGNITVAFDDLLKVEWTWEPES